MLTQTAAEGPLQVGIRREIEAAIEFQGSLHCIACGPEHCCFTCDRYLYIWPVFADAPLPALELPFVPATIAIYESQLIAISAEAVVVLALGDEIVTQQAALAPKGGATLFPIVSSSQYSRSGQLAVAFAAGSSSFMIVSGLEGFTNIEYCLEDDAENFSGINAPSLNARMYSIPKSENGPFEIEHAAFGPSHLYLVSRVGRFAALPLDYFSLNARPSEDGRDDDEVETLPLTAIIFSQGAAGLEDIFRGSPLGKSASELSVTSIAVDSSDRRVLAGLDDGSMVALSGPACGPACTTDKPFVLLAIVDVRTPLVTKKQLQTASLIAGGESIPQAFLGGTIDPASVKCPLVSLVLSEVTPRSTACIASPFGYAFVDVEGICGTDNTCSRSSTPFVVHLELNSATDDGVSPVIAVGSCMTGLAWHSFRQTVVLSLFVPSSFPLAVSGGAHAHVSAAPEPVSTLSSYPQQQQCVLDLSKSEVDRSEVLEAVGSILAANDKDITQLGWAGVMRSLPLSTSSHSHPDGGGEERVDYNEPERPLTAQGLYDDPTVLEDLMAAKIPLGPKYTTPLELQVPGATSSSSSVGSPLAPSQWGVGKAGPAAPRQTMAKTTAPKPLVSAYTGRPLPGSTTKPVTFGKPIKGSGYGASVNTPWSVLQEQKKKKAAADAAKAKLRGQEVKLGEERPLPSGATPPVTPAVIGGMRYFFDVAKSGPPITPKVRSNEVMARPENKVHCGAISALTYNAGATGIITGSSDATLHYLRCPISAHKGDGKAMRGHTAPVLSVDASLALAGHPLVASGARDGCIAVWAPSRREAPYVMENVAGPKEVNAVKFFYQDKLIAAGVGSQIKFYRYVLDYGGGDLDRGRNLSRLSVADQYRTDAQAVTALDCANSFLSTVVAWSGSNKQFGLIDIGAQRTVRRTDEAHTRAIHSLCLVAANTRFASPAVGNNLLHCCATAALDKTIKVWDLRVPDPSLVFSNHMNVSQQVGLCFSPCGTYVVVGSEDRSAFVYDTRGGTGGTCVARLATPDVVTACRYHPLEPVVALGTAGGDIRLFGV